MSALPDSPSPLTELRELLEHLCDGTLAPDGYTRIEQLVQADQAATDFYIDYVWLHGELHWQLTPSPPDGREDDHSGSELLLPADAGADAASAETEPALSLTPVPPAGPPVLGFLSGILNGMHLSPRTMMLMLAGALAGYFLVVMALIPLARSLKPPVMADLAGPAEPGRPGQKVGLVSAEPQAHWTSKTPAFTDAAARIGERYELASGRVQINLLHGTRVIVEGPASWHIESEQRFHLNSGQLSAVVPKPAIGFAVVTPVAEIVDLGTEFDVLVHLGGKTDVHVQRGSVEVKRVRPEGNVPQSKITVPDVVTLSAGGAVSVVSGGRVVAIPFEPHWLRAEQAAAARGDVHFDPKSKIWLGNLFDDPRGTPLTRAMETDTLCATPEVGDLGIQRVIHAGDWSEGPVGGDWVNGAYQPDGLIQIAPHVSFDFANLGWHGRLRGSIANDALGKFDVLPNGGPLSTRGMPSPTDGPKLEEGIGMHGDSLITFDLAQIRAAGRLDAQSLEFVCDRIGMNDDEISSRELASFHMIVLVSDDASVQTAIVDGRELKLDQQSDIWSVVSPPTEPMRADGRFISLRVPIPPEAKYLTLVVTSFDDNNSMDHGVWSGARLGVVQSAAP